MSEITKQELMVMIEVQSKTASSMESIAGSMRNLAEQNKEILAAQKVLVESMAKCQTLTCEKVIGAVDKKFDERARVTDEIKTTASSIKSDTAFMKWVFGGVGIVVCIAFVILKIMGK